MRKLLSFLIILILMTSCDGNRAISTNGVSETAPAAEGEGVQRSQDRVNSIEKSITASRTKKKSHQNVVSIENYSEKRFLMAGKSSPVVPQDFIIGKIVDSSLKSDSAEAAVAQFFDDYRAGKISKNPAGYFLSENRTLLTMLFEEWHNSRFFPASVRIGNGLASESETKVTARCFMGDGDCICEFVMAKDGGKWKIKSFSGNLEEMTAPAPKREEFEPEVYYFF
ncbi:MAG: hypothetical protein IKZ57_02275 [Spirochaetia bacterium]|nr:hypothetical protein [Spirochaetia bacterium]MBR5915256.1 hypothetical protein [Spirochaetia bacterium]